MSPDNYCVCHDHIRNLINGGRGGGGGETSVDLDLSCSLKAGTWNVHLSRTPYFGHVSVFLPASYRLLRLTSRLGSTWKSNTRVNRLLTLYPGEQWLKYPHI